MTMPPDLNEIFEREKLKEKEEKENAENPKRCGYCTQSLCICGKVPMDPEPC